MASRAADGSRISWYSGKNPTVKQVKKKTKGKGRKPVTATREEPTPSFFNFFNPPKVLAIAFHSLPSFVLLVLRDSICGTRQHAGEWLYGLGWFFLVLLQLPEIEDEDDMDDDLIYEMQNDLDRDFEIGTAIKDMIIPDAVSWFTGEALDYLDEDAYIDDYEDYEDEEEEMEPEPEPKPPKKASKAKGKA